MSNAEKSVTIERRSDRFKQSITPAAWKKMQDKGKGEFFREVTAPSVPKEVAAKVANDKKLAGSQTPASDQHHDSTTKTAEHPGKVSGSNT